MIRGYEIYRAAVCTVCAKVRCLKTKIRAARRYFLFFIIKHPVSRVREFMSQNNPSQSCKDCKEVKSKRVSAAGTYCTQKANHSHSFSYFSRVLKIHFIIQFKMQKGLKILFLLLATVLQIAESRTLNLFAVWFKRPYKGPECVVEVIGADLDEKANKRFDMWSKPDIVVKCTHGRWERSTQIEGNTLKPRFVWQAKMPWKKDKGFDFTVYDANVLIKNNVIGRTFIGAKRAKEIISSEKSVLLNIGDGVGFLKVNICKTPVTLKKKIQDVKDTVRQQLE